VTILQEVAAVAEKAMGFHIIEVMGFGGVGLAMWRFSLQITGKIADLKGYISTLNQEVKDHIKGAPTLVTCAEQTLHIKKLIDTRDDKLRDEVQYLVLEHADKVEGLIRRENKRWGQNGVT